MKAYRFQVEESEIVTHEELVSFEFAIGLDFLNIVSYDSFIFGTNNSHTIWVCTKGETKVIHTPKALTNQKLAMTQTGAFMVFEDKNNAMLVKES